MENHKSSDNHGEKPLNQFTKLQNAKVTATYVALQTVGGVRLRGEAAVRVGALCAPGLASHTEHGDGGGTPVRLPVSNFTV